MAESCTIEGCDNPPAGDLCLMHRARLRRGTPMHAPVQERGLPLFEAHARAAIELRDSDSDDDHEYRAARDRFRKTGLAWLTELFGARGARALAAKMTKRQRHARAKKAARIRWSEKNCLRAKNAQPQASAKRPAENAKSQGQNPLRENAAKGKALREGQQSRQEVRQGRERESRRPSEDGQGDPLARAAARPACPDAPGARHQEQGRADRRAVRGGGARPRGTQGVQRRADGAQRKRDGEP